MPRSRIRCWLVLGVLAALGCRSSSAPAYPRQPGQAHTPYEPFAVDAAVRFINIETGCWVLDTPQGSYDPLSLPSAYKIDGRRVSVVMHVDTGVSSICFLGDPLVSVDSIRGR